MAARSDGAHGAWASFRSSRRLLPFEREVQRMKHWVVNEIAVVFLSAGLVSSGLGLSGCERTADGIKQDTYAATASANDQAERAKRELQSQMDAFKSQTNAQLERLSASLAQLEAQTNSGMDESRQKLQAELAETKAKLGSLQAESGAELERAKSDLGARISDLGARMNSALHDVGDKVDKTLH